jgi:hypothetical protein
MNTIVKKRGENGYLWQQNKLRHTRLRVYKNPTSQVATQAANDRVDKQIQRSLSGT